MKPVVVFAILCIAAALAVPIAIDESNVVAPATLSFEGPVESIADNSDASSNSELVRPKRFLLKKLILAKAGLLGLGWVCLLVFFALD